MSTSFDHEYWMEQALTLALEAGALGEVPVGAIVVLNDQIIGRGSNGPIHRNDPTAHAEIVALREAASAIANYRLTQATLYVTIEPCTMCLGALVHARIKHLCFGASEAKAGVVVSNGGLVNAAWFNHKIEVTGNVLAEQCSTLMSDFFAKRRAEKKAQKLL